MVLVHAHVNVNVHLHKNDVYFSLSVAISTMGVGFLITRSCSADVDTSKDYGTAFNMLLMS